MSELKLFGLRDKLCVGMSDHVKKKKLATTLGTCVLYVLWGCGGQGWVTSGAQGLLNVFFHSCGGICMFPLSLPDLGLLGSPPAQQEQEDRKWIIGLVD